MLVVKKFKFEAAHWLPNYEGKCKEMHGHTFRVEVAVEGLVNPKTGMVLDFAEINLMVLPLIDILDHKILNDIISNPTAENLASFIFTYISKHYKEVLKFSELKIASVRVQETDNNYAILKKEREELSNG